MVFPSWHPIPCFPDVCIASYCPRALLFFLSSHLSPSCAITQFSHKKQKNVKKFFFLVLYYNYLQHMVACAGVGKKYCAYCTSSTLHTVYILYMTQKGPKTLSKNDISRISQRCTVRDPRAHASFPYRINTLLRVLITRPITICLHTGESTERYTLGRIE